MFESIFVGGTFDRFHTGHQYLLKFAYGVANRITIGLTSNQYVQKYKKGPHKSFEERKNVLEEWLNLENISNRTSIIPIDDPYEPAVSSNLYQALIVTQHTKKRGEEINSIRIKNSLPAVTLVEVPIIAAEDGIPISSTRIRNGEIDTKGHLVMPVEMRLELSKPLGIVHGDEAIGASIMKNINQIKITVGDVTTQVLISHGCIPNLSIIDLRVRRNLTFSLSDFKFPEKARVIRLKSGPGYISKKAILEIENIIKNHINENNVLIIDGEEDLLVLPTVILAPIDSVIYYGQPPVTSGGSEIEGLVELHVNGENKEIAMKLLKQFEDKLV